MYDDHELTRFIDSPIRESVFYSLTQIVNFVGVQCEVKEEPQDAFRERLRKILLPEELMRDASDGGAE